MPATLTPYVTEVQSLSLRPGAGRDALEARWNSRTRDKVAERELFLGSMLLQFCQQPDAISCPRTCNETRQSKPTLSILLHLP